MKCELHLHSIQTISCSSEQQLNWLWFLTCYVNIRVKLILEEFAVKLKENIIIYENYFMQELISEMNNSANSVFWMYILIH